MSTSWKIVVLCTLSFTIIARRAQGRHGKPARPGSSSGILSASQVKWPRAKRFQTGNLFAEIPCLESFFIEATWINMHTGNRAKEQDVLPNSGLTTSFWMPSILQVLKIPLHILSSDAFNSMWSVISQASSLGSGAKVAGP